MIRAVQSFTRSLCKIIGFLSLLGLAGPPKLFILSSISAVICTFAYIAIGDPYRKSSS
jgi:hypothetical protein